MYACGYNTFGQLGIKVKIKKKIRNLNTPRLVTSLSRKTVLQVAAGWNHSIVLVSPNFVYTAGVGKKGVLGLGDTEQRRSFTWISKLMHKNVTEIFAGGYHSFFMMNREQPDLPSREPSPLQQEKTENISPSESIDLSNYSKSPNNKSRAENQGFSQYVSMNKKKNDLKRYTSQRKRFDNFEINQLKGNHSPNK